MQRRKQIRLKNFDYSTEGAYFVTICVNGRDCILGKIVDGCMKLSLMGEIVNQYWNLIPEIYPNIYLDEYVIMPNHLHGIIVNVGAVINRPHDGAIDNRPYGKLSQIIKSYKQMVTKHIRKQNIYFQWQRNYHDHIIRNETDLHRIREYIINNPLQWATDENNIVVNKK
ncbi:MAG: transposase [Candidatus Omnitrophica bacterium]|nr:transposase [Candidatus Omnitrophota bacterium]